MRYRYELGPATALALVLGLGLTACSSDVDSSDQPTAAATQPGNGVIKVSSEYYENGTRITHYDGIVLNQYARDVLSYCDGPYIIDMDLTDDLRAGNSVARTLASEICADGKLTPEDFQAPTSN